MPLFTVAATDRPDSFDLRAATRPRHLDWLAGSGLAVRLAGPWLDGEGRPVGSLLIVEAPDLKAAQAWAAKDPYAAAGLFAAVEVRPWRLAVGGFGAGSGLSG